MSRPLMTNQVCPGCGESAWGRQQLGEHLHGWCCQHCLGILLSMDDYRDWKRQHPQASAAQVPPSLLAEDGPVVRLCGDCGRIMGRLRAGAEPDFHLDFCHGCQSLWLDAGEWPRLVEAGLLREVDTLLKETTQQRLDADDHRQRRNEELRRRLGEEVYLEAARIRRWLDGQPQRSDVLRVLLGDTLH